ncbi:hypothetical protein [Epilithonimonas tenax]|uniref:hypothetical protein n=1 Tax=Epilithonimonas tenax TaxID=191577 RepID=UPI000480E0CE|nr:hypothetical protein [Epilithonimonas tenax]
MKIQILPLGPLEKKPLFLVMQRQYFDQIDSGEKTEEYRHGGKFYISRFCKSDKTTGKIIAMRNYTSAILQEGYNPGARRMVIEVKKIEYDGEFTIYLGGVSERLNFDQSNATKRKASAEPRKPRKPTKKPKPLQDKLLSRRNKIINRP